MSTTKDKYDLAIEYLMEHPEEIEGAWDRPYQHEAGVLFSYVNLDPFDSWDAKRDLYCGCLTQIRNCTANAFTPELEQAIVNDTRIPRSSDGITIATLPIFAEWQRRIDKELGRV